MAMLVPNAARQLVTNPFFSHFLGVGGGCLGPCELAHVMYAS